MAQLKSGSTIGGYLIITQANLSATTPLALGTATIGISTNVAREDHVHAMPSLDALSNTTITSNAAGEILKWSGSAWINNTLSEAGIAPTAHNSTATTYGVASTTDYGHVKIGDGIAVTTGTIAADVDGTSIILTGTSPNKKIAHADTSSVANLTAAARTYVTGLTFDTYGHVTGLTTGAETVVDTNTVTTLTAGTYITVSDGDASANYNYTVSHADTSTQASVNNSNGTVIQDVTLDGAGHVTALGSIDLDGRYYTESEINDRLNNIVDNFVLTGCAVTTHTTALTLNIAAGSAFVSGIKYTITATTKTVTAAAINYVYINTSGAVTVSTTAPTGDYADLATIAATAAGTVVAAGSITDTRDIVTSANGKMTWDLYNDASTWAQTIISRGPGSGLLIKNAGTANALTIYDLDVSKDMFTIDGAGNTKLLNAADFIIYSDAGTTQRFLIDGANGNTWLYNAADLIICSDAGTTQKFSVDGATGAIVGKSSLTLAGTVFYDDVSRYWLATATNWGLYWNTTDNTLEFHGGGAMKAKIDLDDGSITAPSLTSAAALSLSSTSTNAVTIDSGTTGAINIGTNANAKTITIGNTTGATNLVVNAGTNKLTLNSTGLGINTAAPAEKLHVTGNARVDGQVNVSSKFAMEYNATENSLDFIYIG